MASAAYLHRGLPLPLPPVHAMPGLPDFDAEAAVRQCWWMLAHRLVLLAVVMLIGEDGASLFPPPLPLFFLFFLSFCPSIPLFHLLVLRCSIFQHFMRILWSYQLSSGPVPKEVSSLADAAQVLRHLAQSATCGVRVFSFLLCLYRERCVLFSEDEAALFTLHSGSVGRASLHFPRMSLVRCWLVRLLRCVLFLLIGVNFGRRGGVHDRGGHRHYSELLLDHRDLQLHRLRRRRPIDHGDAMVHLFLQVRQGLARTHHIFHF